MRKLVSLALLLVASLAWNDKGHMVTARLAWKKPTDNQNCLSQCRPDCETLGRDHRQSDPYTRWARPGSHERCLQLRWGIPRCTSNVTMSLCSTP
jgi:hypothetical protein